MPLTRVKTPTSRGFKYTPRKRRSLAGRLFESLIVGLIIVFGLVAWLTLYACFVAAPVLIVVLVLHLLGAF